MPRLLLLCSLLATVAVLAACGDDGGSEATTPTTVTLDQSASGTTVPLAPKQTAEITLPANASTGYHWVVVKQPDPAVVSTGPAGYQAGAAAAAGGSTTTTMVGQAGQQQYAFTGVATGQAAFAAAYMPPGRQGAAGQTFSVVFDVK